MAEQKVNCRVLNLSDGSHQLVFTVEGTKSCVGEIVVKCDEQYLRVMTHMFNSWVEMQRPSLHASVRNILNGHSAANSR